MTCFVLNMQFYVLKCFISSAVIDWDFKIQILYLNTIFCEVFSSHVEYYCKLSKVHMGHPTERR